jgi:hypothetical protein
MIRKLLCFLGNHAWLPFSGGYGRRCQLCGEWQYQHEGRWYYDLIGSASPRIPENHFLGKGV